MEKYYRKKVKLSKDQKLKFQIISWEKFDVEINGDENDLEYKIYAFGITDTDNSICVEINEFTPFFYVKIPDHLQDNWTDFKTEQVKLYLRNKMYKLKESLLRVTLVEKKDINGFTNDKDYKFLKIIFKNEKAFTKCKYILCPGKGRPKPVITNICKRDLDFKLYEANIEPFIRFCHIQDIKTAGWCEIDKYFEEDNSRCQIDISCKWKNINPIDVTTPAKIYILSFDIESFSDRGFKAQKNIFPDPDIVEDVVTQIGSTLHIYGTKIKAEYCFTLNSPKDKYVEEQEDIITVVCDNEKDLLKKWIMFLRKLDPDIITGYNINNFDWDYIYKRCKMLEIDLDLQYLTRLYDQPAKFKTEKLITSAYGENIFKYVSAPGVLNSDLYTIIKREKKLPIYKLGFVANEYIGDHKDPLSAIDLFNMEMGTAKEIAIVIHYCVKDCTLVIDLILKLCIITNNIAMANVTRVPIEYIESKGQQIKVHSQLTYEARLNNYLVPTIPYKDASELENEEKFTGATVQDAESDAHFEQITGLDFASLYPSIMIANNYSYETIVKHKEFDDLEDIEYKDIIWKEDIGTEKERTERVRFVQNKKGLLPIMLEKLWKERKAIKKEMKKVKEKLKELEKSPKDPEKSQEEIEEEKDNLKMQYDVHDGFQLAMKVSMNSIYGFTGANLGRLPEKRIAAATTAEGRRMIQSCKEYVESEYDCKVVYGDSVADYTPIYININNELKIIKIKELENYTKNNWQYCKESDKLFIDVTNDNIFTWTENKWTHLKTIIKHKLNSSKKIVRILTHTGLVDVTDDHSLLKEDKTEISPKNISIGDTLLHYNNPIYTNSIIELSVEEAKIFGFFFGDGSCGYYECKSGNKGSWALNNKNLKLLNKYEELCRNVYPNFEWKILNTINSSNIYKLTFNSHEYGSKVEFIKKYRNYCYSEKNKIIPDFIMNNTIEIKEAFLEGLYDADGDKDKNGYIRIDQKSQISSCHIKWLFESLGYNTSINTRKDKENIYRITATLNSQRKKLTEIKKINYIDYEGDVYDLTTDNHHFAAGIGNIIVHNTDSIYVKFFTEYTGQEHMNEVFRLSEIAAEGCTKLFKKPVEMEFEKVMWPFILFSKKRYACVIWTNEYKHDYIDYKGIQVVRRDNCPYVKEKSMEIFEKILLDRDIPKSIEMGREFCKNLLNGQVPMKELIISKSLKGYGSYEFDKQVVCVECGKRWYNEETGKKVYKIPMLENKTLEENVNIFIREERYCYTCKENTTFKKNKANIPHVALARLMKERDPYNCPQVGERVPYVFKKVNNPRALQFERVEDPDYMVQNCIPIDFDYYFEHQFKSAIETIFTPILKNELDEKLFKDIVPEKPPKRTRKAIK